MFMSYNNFMIDEIKKAIESYGGEWKEHKGIWEFKAVIAERKVFLSKKKLTYIAKLRIIDAEKLVKFTEMLFEAGSGLSTGGDFDSGMSSGFGFKAETYNTFKGSREGNIEEQSTLFGKNYTYNFDYKDIRSKVETLATAAGYQFAYQITSIGL